MRNNRRISTTDAFVTSTPSALNALLNPGGTTGSGANSVTNSGMVMIPGHSVYDTVQHDGAYPLGVGRNLTHFNIPILSGNSIRVVGRFGSSLNGASTGTDVANYTVGLILYDKNHNSSGYTSVSVVVSEGTSPLVDLQMNWDLSSFCSVGQFIDIKITYQVQVISYTGYGLSLYIPYFCCVDSAAALGATNPATFVITNATAFTEGA